MGKGKEDCATVHSAWQTQSECVFVRFNRSFWDEVLDANLLNSIPKAQEAAEIWVMDYN